MGPCTSPNQKYFDGMYTKANWDFLTDHGIYVIDGPNWEADRAVIMAEGSQSLIDTILSAEHLANNPIQAVAAYAQTSLTNRFQKYTDDWFDYMGSNNGAMPHTELLDFGLIKKTKVALYAGLFDDTCPLTTAVDIHTQLGENNVAKWTVAPWQGHVPWGFSASPWFINDMAETLQMNQ